MRAKVTRNPDGTVTVTKPDGTVVTTKRTPPSPENQQKLTEAIERWHRNLGPVE